MFYWENEMEVRFWAASCKMLNIVNSVYILVNLVLYCSLDLKKKEEKTSNREPVCQTLALLPLILCYLA